MPASKHTATPEANVNTTVNPDIGQQNLLAIGHIVHFVMPDLSQRPAIVTQVYGTDGHGDLGIMRDTDGAAICDLVVFTTAEEHGAYGAAYGVGKVEYDASGQQPNSWHWRDDTAEQVTPQTQTGAGVPSSSGSGSDA